MFCSDTAYQRYGAGWHEVAPGLTVVQLRGTAPLTDEELASIDIAFFSGDVYPDRVRELLVACLKAPNLRWLHAFTVGTDASVYSKYLERGVLPSNSAGASAIAIAHSVIMHLIALCRNARLFAVNQSAHRWDIVRGADVEGRVVGIMGMGNIGSNVARLAQPFGVRAIGMRRTPTGDEPCETWPIGRLGELLSIVDTLVLAMPNTDATREIIGAAQFAAMRPGAHLINVGRGDLVDQAALVEALGSGQLGGAALDVFKPEPLAEDSPLWDMPNVIITPHAAGATELSRTRAVEVFTDNLGRYARGEPLRNLVG